MSVVAVAAVGAAVSREQPGSAPATHRAQPSQVAIDALARGRFLFARREPGDLERARAAYEDGLAAAPEDANLWSALASTVYLQARSGQIDEAAGMERMRVAAERAVALDPSLAEPYLRIAIYYWWQQDDARGHQYLERARRADPDHPLLLALLADGAARRHRFEEAAQLARRSLARDPLNLNARNNLMFILLAGGHEAEAEAEARRLAELHANDDSAVLVGQIRIARGDRREAERWFAQVRGEAERAQAAALLRAARDRTRPDPELKALAERYGPTDPFMIAEIYAFRGDADRAFEWLDRAAQIDYFAAPGLGFRAHWSMPSSPLLASLRGDARWARWESEVDAASH